MTENTRVFWQYQAILCSIMESWINNKIANIDFHIGNNMMNNTDQHCTILKTKLTTILETILLINIDDNMNQFGKNLEQSVESCVWQYYSIKLGTIWIYIVQSEKEFMRFINMKQYWTILTSILLRIVSYCHYCLILLILFHIGVNIAMVWFADGPARLSNEDHGLMVLN